MQPDWGAVEIVAWRLCTTVMPGGRASADSRNGVFDNHAALGSHAELGRGGAGAPHRLLVPGVAAAGGLPVIAR